MWALRAVLLGGCLVALAGCEPDLNDNECDTDEDCSYRPGTVCSPENWCVVPVAARPDQSVPDAMVVQDAMPSMMDMAASTDAMTPVQADQGPVTPDQGASADDDATPTLDPDAAASPADGGSEPLPADGGPQALPADGGPQALPADGGPQALPADGGPQALPDAG